MCIFSLSSISVQHSATYISIYGNGKFNTMYIHQHTYARTLTHIDMQRQIEGEYVSTKHTKLRGHQERIGCTKKAYPIAVDMNSWGPLKALPDQSCATIDPAIDSRISN